MMNNIMQNKEMIRRKNGYVSIKTFFRFSIIFVFAIIVTFLIELDGDRPNYYLWLPALPIGHTLIIGICMFINGRLLEEWQTVLAIGIYSIRNLFTPLIMHLGNYYGSFRQLNNENVKYAIVLMLYETMIVFLFLSIYGKRKIISINMNEYCEKKTSNSFKIMVGLIVLFCTMVRFIIPDVRMAYTTLFSTEGLRVKLLTSAERGGGIGQRGIFTLFQVFLPIAYTFLGVALLSMVNKILRKNRIIKILITILIILIPSFFMDGGDGNTIIFITALFLTALFIDNRTKGSMLKIAVIGGSVIVVYIFIQAMVSTFFYSNISLWQSLSNMFQSYFPGVCNMAGLFNIKEYDKFSHFFYDLYSTIPFRESLFGLSGVDTIPNLYTYDNNAESHIMPCIAHAFYYFGIFAPIIPCYIYKKSIDIYNKMKKTTDPYRFVTYTLIFLYLILTPIMYNIIIFLRHFMATFLPMLFLCYLNGRENNKQKDYEYEK